MRGTQPRRRFFELLDAAAANLVAAARMCAELFDRFPEVGDRVERIRRAEAAGDDLAAELYRSVAGTYVTPIDRQDLHALASALDDVCDLVEEAATSLELLAVEVVGEEARAQARLLLEACERLGDAVARLDRLPSLTGELADVYAIEDRGDDIVRGALARLFASGEEPMALLRAKIVHEHLEAALDAAASAAHVLERITLKAR